MFSSQLNNHVVMLAGCERETESKSRAGLLASEAPSQKVVSVRIKAPGYLAGAVLIMVDSSDS